MDPSGLVSTRDISRGVRRCASGALVGGFLSGAAGVVGRGAGIVTGAVAGGVIGCEAGVLRLDEKVTNALDSINPF